MSDAPPLGQSSYPLHRLLMSLVSDFAPHLYREFAGAITRAHVIECQLHFAKECAPDEGLVMLDKIEQGIIHEATEAFMGMMNDSST